MLAQMFSALLYLRHVLINFFSFRCLKQKRGKCLNQQHGSRVLTASALQIVLATCRHSIFSQSSLQGSSVVIWKLSSLLLSSVGGLTTKAKAFWQSTYLKKKRQKVNNKNNYFFIQFRGKTSERSEVLSSSSVCQELELQTTWFG